MVNCSVDLLGALELDLQMVGSLASEINNQEEKEWQRARWLAANIMNASGNLKRSLQPTDLLKLPSDGKL